MMGMSFNGVGKYVGWSNIFDYSSLESIQLSEYLPYPNKTTFVKNEQTGYNIDLFIVRINESNLNRPARIRAYADLLTYLNDNNISEINWTIEPVEDIINILNSHEHTIIPKNMVEMASKNFISSHIQNTVQNFTNMIGAYSPIEMEDFRSASNNSPKGEQSKRMTLMNPATKYLMQYLNITGKKVIGIAATGIKGAFTWHYYMNEILLNNVNNSNADLIERAKFTFETNRINDRAKATDPKTYQVKPDYSGTKIIKAIPDINFNNLNPETLLLLFGELGNINDNVLKGNLTVDLLLSQVLSAATDNAKELILAKVNAGSKLAKCYLFLITMGFNINDIVSFMTSPVVDFIDKITENNIYQGGSLNILDVIKFLKGDIPSKLYHKFLDKKGILNITNNDNLKKQIKDSFVNNNLDSIRNPFIKGDLNYYGFIDLITELKLIRNLMPEMNDSAKLDLLDFEKVLEGADEFSNFGRLLGINQGIKTTEKDFKGYLLFIRDIIALREKALGLNSMTPELIIENGFDINLVGKFDVNKWLFDLNYKQQVRDYYAKIKVALPIFDMIEEIPQFRDSFKLVNAVNKINTAISLKTKVLDCILDHYIANFWSDNFRNNLLHSIQAKFIEQFLYNSNLRLPYMKGIKIGNSNFDEVNATEDSFLSLKSVSDLAAFKYLFETYIIPKLKEGKYITVENGKIVEIDDPSLKANKFIQGLIEGNDKDLPVYRANVDMLNYDLTPEGTMKMENYIKGLLSLLSININGLPLSDWFIIYNLYTNRNNYGTNRLTTLFDSFIDNNGNSSIIKDYLNYIGKLDYYGTAEWATNGEQESILIDDGQGNSFSLDVEDLFMLSAVTVFNTIGKGDPMYRVVQENGSIFMKRRGISYSKVDNQYFSGDTSEQTMNRQNYIDSYVTLGGLAQEAKARLIENLNKLNYNTIIALNQLLLDNFLEIYKRCE